MKAQKQDSTLNRKGLFIKINLLQLIMGEARLQLEKPIKNRKSVELIMSYFWDLSLMRDDFTLSSLNYGLTGLRKYPDDYPIRNGGKLGLGYKLFLKPSFNKKRTYCESVVFYKLLHYTNITTYTPLNIEITDIYYHIVSLQFQYGKCNTWKKFVLDYYIGVGARYKYGIAWLKPTLPEVEIPPHRKLESWIYPSINFGINIEYNFNCKSK
ncbi:MAG: hypothetical protein AABZ32_00320 [Bacteroidota bacterium]